MSHTNVIWLWLGVCLLGANAAAQGGASPTPVDPLPMFEVGVNYAYNTLATSYSGEMNQSGATIFGEYFPFKAAPSRWGGHSRLSLTGEFGGSGSASGSFYTYLFGPRWGVEWRDVRIYGGVAAGGDHVRVNGVDPSGSPVSFSRNGFASSVALAGFELQFGKHFVLRLEQGDDLNMEVRDPTSGQSHWRGGLRESAGIGFRFGQR